MPYPPEVTEPMREELIQIGVQELRPPEEVGSVLKNPGTVLVFVKI
jgi:putative YphP/YqiW family bacilliredoxin